MLVDRDTEAAPSDALLTAFSGYITQHLGLHFPRGQWPELVRAAQALDVAGAGAGACMRRLMAAPPTRGQIEQLAHQLTIGETYFFREPAVFDALEHEVLPALIAARRAAGRTLRIWSAGCCTGEELYSVAILLQRLIPDLADWRITLLGTDVNAGFLRKAEQGRYRDWSFRAVPAWLVWRHFGPPQDGLRAIAPALRRGVRFDYLNLAADLFPGPEVGAPPMDLILCRNVLMYFEPASGARALQRLGRALAPDGWLAVGMAEAGHALLAPFEPVRFPSALLYRQRPEALRAELVAAATGLHSAVPAAAAAAIAVAPTGTATIVVEPLRDVAAIADASAGQPPIGAGPVESAPNVAASTEPAPALALQARRCADLGLLDDASLCCAAAIATDKCDPALRYLQALIMEEQGRAAEAIGALKDALYLDPDFVLAHFTLGSLCRRNGALREAQRHFANALELLRGHAPDDVLAHSGGVRAGELADLMRAGAGAA
ncbi:CheR family methyltransferase [Duganella sp. S19_KUP01_CR8]|uniref:CheR family methyltransferase n=1 Tax=Duganella sp. S19_KUP01_CR8 TaxID=3025502 RepID=UPI002FCDA920